MTPTIHSPPHPPPGRGLALPPGAQLPEAIQRALESAPRNSIGNRESLQRKRFWWLPYVVLEFDKNEILIDALGGDLSNPIWNYRAQLYVLIHPNFYVPRVTKTVIPATSLVHPTYLFHHTFVPLQSKVMMIWEMIYS